MRVKAVFMLIGLTLMLTSCSDTTILKQSVNEHNSSVEYILVNYEKNKSAAQGVEGQLLTLLENPNRELVNSLQSITAKKELIDSIAIINTDIVEYANMLYQQRVSENLIQGVNNPIDLKALKEENILSSIEVHYFLEPDKGIVVQTFLVPMEMGKTGVLENKWVNGKCFNSSYTKL